MPVLENCLSQLENTSQYPQPKRAVSRERCWRQLASVTMLQKYLFPLTSLIFILSRHFLSGIPYFFVCFSIKQVDWLLDTYLRHIHNLWSVFNVLVFVFIVQKCSQDYCLKKLLPGKQCHSSHPKFCWIFIFQINGQARYYKQLNSKKVQTRLFLILKTLWFPLCF